MAIFVSAFVLGVMGSFHCAGMCGPIALTLPLHGKTFYQKTFGGLLYNSGRIITYGIMGFLFGLLGHGIRLLGFQQKISVVMGLLMIVAVFFPALFKYQSKKEITWFRIIGRLKKSMGRLFSVKSFSSLFFIGIMNGLLPCGLVYISIAGAIAAGNPVEGALYMMLFGLGTLPMMMGISLAGNAMGLAIRQRINKIIPVLVVVVGLLFILRGLDLGIPYLSPERQMIETKFEKLSGKDSLLENDQQLPACCQKKDSTVIK